MTKQTEGTLANTRDVEVEGPHAHTMLKHGIANEIRSIKKELSESTKSKHFSAETKAAAEKDLAVEEKSLAMDTQHIDKAMITKNIVEKDDGFKAPDQSIYKFRIASFELLTMSAISVANWTVGEEAGKLNGEQKLAETLEEFGRLKLGCGTG